MKSFFKKSRLTVLTMTSLLSGMYAESAFSSQPTVTVGVDGSFITSKEGDITEELINKKINDLKNDKSLTEYTIAKEGEENTPGKIFPDKYNQYIPTKYGKYVTENTFVTVNNDVSGYLYGVYIYDADNTEKSIGNVIISNGDTGSIHGIMSWDDGVAGGNVYMVGGNVGSITGSEAPKAVGNVYMTGGDVVGDITGAYQQGSANSGEEFGLGNVYIVNGNVGRVYGVEGFDGKVTGNVFMNGGTFLSLQGAQAIGSSEVKGNVYIFGDIKVSTYNESYLTGIYNGYAPKNASYEALLSMASSPLTVNNLNGFMQYNFYINEYNKEVVGDENNALLTVTDLLENVMREDSEEGIFSFQPHVKLAGISKADVLGEGGNTIVLIDATGASINNYDGYGSQYENDFSGTFGTKDGDTGETNVGLAGKADVTYHVIDNDDEKKITATVDNYHIDDATLNKNLKPLAEGRLTTLENAVRSAEALQDVMGEHKPMGTFTPIAEISGGINQYNGSTSIESRDYRLIVGSRYQVLDNLYTGIALDYGRSNYNSDNGDKRGEGNTYNYGASLFGKYTHSLALGDVYFDGALRLGRTSTDMKSNDIITSNKEFAGYKSKVNYVGINAGLGFIYKLNEKSSFDTSTHYYWTRLGSDNITIDGDDIHFDSTNSSKIQFKEQYNYKTTDNLTFTLAGVYEYEFDSKAGASSSDTSIDAPSIQGSTGIVELGINGTPIAENKNFNFNLKFRGYAGKRNGVSASTFFEYDF